MDDPQVLTRLRPESSGKKRVYGENDFKKIGFKTGVIKCSLQFNCGKI